MSDIKPIQDVFYPSGGRRRGYTRSNEIDSVRDMNRSLLGQLDEARSELAQLRAERDAAILRGDTYRRRAMALMEQCQHYRVNARAFDMWGAMGWKYYEEEMHARIELQQEHKP